VHIKLTLLTALLMFPAAASAQAADATDKTWTLSVTGNYSEVQDSDPALSSSVGGVSLSHTSGGTTLGLSVSKLKSDDTVSDTATIDGADGLFWSGFVSWTLGETMLDLTGSYAHDKLDGSGVATGGSGGYLAGEEVTLDGSSNSYGVSIGLSRAYDMGGFSLTPHGRLSYDETRTKATLALVNGIGPGVQLEQDASGTTFTGGLTVSAPATGWLDLYADISGVAASNEAASPFSTSGRTTRTRTTDTSQEDSVTWAEAYFGATLHPAAGLSLDLSVGGTSGRTQDEVFGGASLSVSF
jgi:hypothetical protein